MHAGNLKHRVTIQYPVELQNTVTGEMNVTWTDLATVWGKIEPLSARDFVAAQSEQSKVTARIMIRYRDDITTKMRLLHIAKNNYYNIEGVLADKESGVGYLTLVVSIGLLI